MEFTRSKSGTGFSYKLDGEPVMSVTRILDAGFPKPALVTWAAKETAGYAIDHWQELDEAPMSERLRTLERAAFARRDKAAFRGTELHTIGEHLARGEKVTVPEHYEGIAQRYADWLDSWDAAPIAIERPVLWVGIEGDHIGGPPYAGTMDLIADLNDGGRWLLDIKTGSGVYESHVLQLAAYRYATHLLAEDGLRAMLEIDSVGVIHVTPDAVRLIPVAADRRAWRVFMASRIAADYQMACKAAWSRREPWPVGQAIEPEVFAR